jgi:putative endonuclease
LNKQWRSSHGIEPYSERHPEVAAIGYFATRLIFRTRPSKEDVRPGKAIATEEHTKGKIVATSHSNRYRSSFKIGCDMGAFVYLLRCADHSYYVGSATGNDLSKRMAEHQSGTFQGYTSSRRPVTLIWSEYFERITDAIAVERQLKGWSRAKKEALIDGQWAMLTQLSKRRSGRAKSAL